MNAWVIMGGDYPTAVFSTEADANKYVRMRQERDRKENLGRRVHWRTNCFEVDQQKEWIE